MSEEKDIIPYRQKKARETLEDARLLYANKRFLSSVNRIYYALFYETSALLLTKGISSSKHRGIKSLFHQHFVKTGKVSKDMGKFYSRMFEFRQDSDYEDFVEFEDEEVNAWLKKAEEFLDTLDKVIENEIL